MVFIIEENIFSHIRTTFHSLSPTQKKIANYILQNPQKVVLHSISALAAECSTSETTIFRFLRKIGYESYQVFRVHVAQDIATNTPQSIYGEIEATDSVADIKHITLMFHQHFVLQVYICMHNILLIFSSICLSFFQSYPRPITSYNDYQKELKLICHYI